MPIVKVDADHFQAQRNDGSTPLIYQIPAGKGFILDISGYEFKIPAGLSVNAPNSIQVIVDQKGSYSVKWDSSMQKINVTAETLIPSSGSQPFTDFKAGQTIALGIGFLDKSSTSAQPQFYVFWVGMIDFR